MITGKELWIDGLNEGIITRYNESEQGLIIEVKRGSDIYCCFTVECYVSAKDTDKKVIIKTYITR